MTEHDAHSIYLNPQCMEKILIRPRSEDRSRMRIVFTLKEADLILRSLSSMIRDGVNYELFEATIEYDNGHKLFFRFPMNNADSNFPQGLFHRKLLDWINSYLEQEKNQNEDSSNMLNFPTFF
ncbi:hypothetical protein MJH12_02900 [bacterium]|nr:hypothetical protein [bacterium]